VTIASDHYVVGFQIAMHDPRGMSFRQAFGYVLQVPEKLSQLRALLMDLLAQRDSVDKLPRDELCAVTLTNLVDVSNVRVIERRRGRRLLFEAAHSILVSGHFRGKSLQRHFAMEPRILRKIDLSHAAGQRATISYGPSVSGWQRHFLTSAQFSTTLIGGGGFSPCLTHSVVGENLISPLPSLRGW
jgi:hypothetical protein